jgi:DNA-binding NtrC family response regulator
MPKILVADNTPSLREAMEWAARGEGREIVSAGSAEEAIRLINEHVFDLVVTDMSMESETAGLEVLRAAKSRSALTQVIVVTAYGTPEASVETMRFGAFDYIERGSPGTDVQQMLRAKIDLALQYRDAKLKSGAME